MADRELLELADEALEEYQREWARWLATGEDEAFRLAMAAKGDREVLLGELSTDLGNGLNGEAEIWQSQSAMC